VACGVLGRPAVDEPDDWHRRLLRARRKRPHRCPAEQRNELAPSQWIELHFSPRSQPDCRRSNWEGSVSGIFDSTPTAACGSIGRGHGGQKGEIELE
jgi:hypothetical protein